MTAAATLARKAGFETLAVRIADATPTLMVFGPAVALLYLLAQALAGVRWAPAA
jgi:hypothetical protein